MVKQQGKTKCGILLPAIKRDLQLSLSLSRLFDINAVKRGRVVVVGGTENMNIQYSKAKVVYRNGWQFDEVKSSPGLDGGGGGVYRPTIKC